MQTAAVAGLSACAAPAFARKPRQAPDRVGDPFGEPDRDRQRAAHLLTERFPDLRRHFVFEYYPWYGTSPYFHWDADGRRPPVDVASNYMPLLGAYDSRDTRVLEQHAKWIAES